MLDLDFKHIEPGALCRLVIRERIVGEWPSMAFAPEAVHEGVDELNERAAIEFGRQETNQFLERLLKKRMIIPRLITRMRVL